MPASPQYVIAWEVLPEGIPNLNHGIRESGRGTRLHTLAKAHQIACELNYSHPSCRHWPEEVQSPKSKVICHRP